MATVGGKKSGGRKKGVPNKTTVFSVRQKLIDLGVDLVAEIIKDIQAIDKPFLRTKCYLQLLEYCDSKRKAIEVTDLTSSNDEISIVSKMPRYQAIELLREHS